MSVDRFVCTQFCDDIRQEVGNKFSLIGCYGTVIQVNPLPSVLPKLCASVKIFTPIARPFEKLVVRIFNGDKPIAELPFPDGGMTNLPDITDGAQWYLASANFTMSPFPVEAACVLRVEAETEEGTIHGGCFWIHGPPAVETPLLPATPP